jgi:hypothetical protein
MTLVALPCDCVSDATVPPGWTEECAFVYSEKESIEMQRMRFIRRLSLKLKSKQLLSLHPDEYAPMSSKLKLATEIVSPCKSLEDLAKLSARTGVKLENTEPFAKKLTVYCASDASCTPLPPAATILPADAREQKTISTSWLLKHKSATYVRSS